MNKYEGMIILPNALNDEGVEKAVQRIQSEIARAGGTVQGLERLGRRSFVHRMQKQDGGFYVRVRFEMDPSATGGLKARLKLAEDIFRVQIIRAPVLRAEPAPAAAADATAKPEGATHG